MEVSSSICSFAGGNLKEGCSMCTCIDNIRASYSEVKRETSRVARRSFQKPVEANFCQITPQEARELLELSEPIDKKMQLLHKKLLKSPLYVGMETVVKLYEDAMDDFDELCHDLQAFRINLEENEEFQALLKKLNESLSR